MTKILVVDDEPDLAESLGELFEAMGHTTKVAYNGQHALAVAAAFQPRIILSMPLLDGFALAKAIRETTSSKCPFLIASSSMIGDDVKARTVEAGFDAFLPKPAAASVLPALIDEIAAR